jgi:hypothetical protein
LRAYTANWPSRVKNQEIQIRVVSSCIYKHSRSHLTDCFRNLYYKTMHRETVSKHSFCYYQEKVLTPVFQNWGRIPVNGQC